MVFFGGNYGSVCPQRYCANFQGYQFFKTNQTGAAAIATAKFTADALGKAIKLRDLKIESVNGDVQTFKTGTYNNATGAVSYTTKTLPWLIEKLTHLHKADTRHPLFYLNIFFGVSLLFFVISSFWMFMPQTSIFKKGLYFTLAGVVLTVVLLLL